MQTKKRNNAELALKVSGEIDNVVDRMEKGYGVKKKDGGTRKAKEVKRSLSDIVDKIE